MAMAIKKVALPMIILGLSTAYLLFSELPPDLSAGCPDIVKHNIRFGNEGLDKFLCSMVQFFKFPIQTTEGLWMMGYLLTTALSCITFMAVEASRFGSSWLLSLTPVYLFLGQVGGISVIVPLLWLPVYFLSNAAAAKSKTGEIPTKSISPWRVVAIKFFMVFLEFIIIAMLVPFWNFNRDILYLAFQPAPVVVAMFWLPFVTTKAADFQLGHKAVMLVHGLGACFGLGWHLVGMFLLFKDPGVPGNLVQILLQHPGNLWCTYFVIVDCLVLFAAFVYVSILEDGIFVALVVTLAAFLLGPAASLSLYFLYRERNIIRLASRNKND